MVATCLFSMALRISRVFFFELTEITKCFLTEQLLFTWLAKPLSGEWRTAAKQKLFDSSPAVSAKTSMGNMQFLIIASRTVDGWRKAVIQRCPMSSLRPLQWCEELGGWGAWVWCSVVQNFFLFGGRNCACLEMFMMVSGNLIFCDHFALVNPERLILKNAKGQR